MSWFRLRRLNPRTVVPVRARQWCRHRRPERYILYHPLLKQIWQARKHPVPTPIQSYPINSKCETSSPPPTKRWYTFDDFRAEQRNFYILSSMPRFNRTSRFLSPYLFTISARNFDGASRETVINLIIRLDFYLETKNKFLKSTETVATFASSFAPLSSWIGWLNLFLHVSSCYLAFGNLLKSMYSTHDNTRIIVKYIFALSKRY